MIGFTNFWNAQLFTDPNDDEKNLNNNVNIKETENNENMINLN